MKILSVGKKPFCAHPWLRVCQGFTLVGLLLTINAVLHTTGLAFALFVLVGTPVLLLAVAIMVVLLVDDLRKRYSLFGVEAYEPGEMILQQGDLADRAYFVQGGAVEVVRVEEGKETVLARLGPGDYFGEMGLLVRDGRRTASVRAVTNTQLLALGKENFDRLLGAIPALYVEFTAKTIQRAKEHSEKRQGSG
jgi:CRP-like cAMP-binding protein